MVHGRDGYGICAGQVQVSRAAQQSSLVSGEQIKEKRNCRWLFGCVCFRKSGTLQHDRTEEDKTWLVTGQGHSLTDFASLTLFAGLHFFARLPLRLTWSPVSLQGSTPLWLPFPSWTYAGFNAKLFPYLVYLSACLPTILLLHAISYPRMSFQFDAKIFMYVLGFFADLVSKHPV